MFLNFAILFSLLTISIPGHESLSFTYNGFRLANLSCDGIASVTSNGLLQATNYTSQHTGHAFYPSPVPFKNTPNGTVFSFSTTFIVAIVSKYPTFSAHGMAFVIAPRRALPGARPSQYLGLFNEANNGNATNHVFAVELDTVQSDEFSDINDNHVGININGLRSKAAEPAGYHDNQTGQFKNLSLISGQRIQVWVEYDGVEKKVDVTLAPINVVKPSSPLLSLSQDLLPIFHETMYIGFSSATGAVLRLLTSHYILGWSFRINGTAQDLNLSQLPRVPRVGPKPRSMFLTIGLPVICLCLMVAAASMVVYVISRKRKFAEVLEDWERDIGPHRFKYKDLYVATKGFKDKELLGTGGFGKVYKGVLPTSKTEIAVKRISHESRQGMREFVSEIVSLGWIRHRNLVQLLGYCRRKGELLLVYDYMSNGSLDKYLYDQPKVTLNWNQRFKVIKGVALGLFHLHEEWEQVVIHRDIKASNVLLDSKLNGRLGDFGLARLYDHGTDPQTTHIVGTLGYLAPEHTRRGKATTSTDVFAFGAFLLEVACGRRPIELTASTDDLVLVDWVLRFWQRGEIVEARDKNLGMEYVTEEVELVLKLGLMCSHCEPTVRPSMRRVVQYLEKEVPLPELTGPDGLAKGSTIAHTEGFDGDEPSQDLNSQVSLLRSGGHACQSSYDYQSLLRNQLRLMAPALACRHLGQPTGRPFGVLTEPRTCFRIQPELAPCQSRPAHARGTL